MSSKLKFVVLGALACAVLVFYWSSLRAVDPEIARSITLSVGDERVYSLHWTSQQKTQLAGAGQDKTIPVEAQLLLDAKWVMQVIKANAEGYVLSARFEQIDNSKLEAMGQDLFAGGLDLTEDEVFFELSRTGRIGQLKFSSSTNDIYRDLVQGLLLQIQYTLPKDGATRWSEALAGPHGSGQVSFTSDEHKNLARTREGYDVLMSLPGATNSKDAKLSATAKLTLDETAFIAAIEDAESILVQKEGAELLRASSELSLQLVERRTNRTLRKLPTAFEGRMLSDRGPSEHAERRLLEARARKISIESLESLVLAHADGSIPDKGELAWRMAALLRLHPELCERLVSLFKKEELSPLARGFVMDLLVASGDVAAQAALRAILLSEEAQNDKEAYGLYMQRLSLLKAPEDDTLDFLEERYDLAQQDQDREVSHSTLMALGAATGAARKHGDEQLSQAYEQRLLRELDAAETKEDSAVRIRALGNTGDVEHVPTITEYASHEDSEVRHASARALYQMASDPEARATLMALSRDPSVSVQAAALQALGNATLGREELSALQQSIQSGQTRTELDGVVLNLVASQQGHEDVKAELLQAVLSRHAGDARLEARVRALLRKQGVL